MSCGRLRRVALYVGPGIYACLPTRWAAHRRLGVAWHRRRRTTPRTDLDTRGLTASASPGSWCVGRWAGDALACSASAEAIGDFLSSSSFLDASRAVCYCRHERDPRDPASALRSLTSPANADREFAQRARAVCEPVRPCRAGARGRARLREVRRRNAQRPDDEAAAFRAPGAVRCGLIVTSMRSTPRFRPIELRRGNGPKAQGIAEGDAYGQSTINMSDARGPERYSGRCERELFGTGCEAALGRAFAPNDEARAQPPWRSSPMRYGARATCGHALVGRAIRVNARPATCRRDARISVSVRESVWIRRRAKQGRMRRKDSPRWRLAPGGEWQQARAALATGMPTNRRQPRASASRARSRHAPFAHFIVDAKGRCFRDAAEVRIVLLSPAQRHQLRSRTAGRQRNVGRRRLGRAAA